MAEALGLFFRATSGVPASGAGGAGAPNTDPLLQHRIKLLRGRGLHLSTSQLNLSRF